MSRNLNINIFNELNESFNDSFKTKKQVFMESDKITTREINEGEHTREEIKGLLDSGAIDDYDYYTSLSDEEKEKLVDYWFEHYDDDLKEAAPINSDLKKGKEERLASLKTQLEQEGNQLADDEKAAIEEEIAKLEAEVYSVNEAETNLTEENKEIKVSKAALQKFENSLKQIKPYSNSYISAVYDLLVLNFGRDAYVYKFRKDSEIDKAIKELQAVNKIPGVYYDESKHFNSKSVYVSKDFGDYVINYFKGNSKELSESEEIENKLYTYSKEDIRTNLFNTYELEGKDAFDLDKDEYNEAVDIALKNIDYIESEQPIKVINQYGGNDYYGFPGGKVYTYLTDGRKFVSEEEGLSIWDAVELTVSNQINESEEAEDLNKENKQILTEDSNDIISRLQQGEELYFRDSSGQAIRCHYADVYPEPEEYDEGYITGWERGKDEEYDKEQDEKYEKAKKASEEGNVWDLVYVEDDLEPNGDIYGYAYGEEELESWLKDLREVKIIKRLEEAYSEKIGGDPKDFIGDLISVKAKLEELNLDGFSTHLAQQVVMEFIETVESQIGMTVEKYDLKESEESDNTLTIDEKVARLKLMDQAARSINDSNVVNYWLTYGIPDEETDDGFLDDAEVYDRLEKEFITVMKKAVKDGLYQCPSEAFELAKEYVPELKNINESEKLNESTFEIDYAPDGEDLSDENTIIDSVNKWLDPIADTVEVSVIEVKGPSGWPVVRLSGNKEEIADFLYSNYNSGEDSIDDILNLYMIKESKEPKKDKKICEAEVSNLQEVKSQGNVYMLKDDKNYIIGENYNPNEGLIENAEIYESKEEADKDYLNRCDVKRDGEKVTESEEILDSLKSRFKKFLDNNVKAKEYNFEAYLDDLTTQYGNTGNTEYELSSSESKSGNPEIFNYDLKDLQNELGYGITESEEVGPRKLTREEYKKEFGEADIDVINAGREPEERVEIVD